MVMRGNMGEEGIKSDSLHIFFKTPTSQRKIQNFFYRLVKITKGPKLFSKIYFFAPQNSK